MIVLEAGTTQYDDDIIQIKKALSHLETLCGASGSSMLGKPVSRFGWTFFQIAIKHELVQGIEKKFADMLARYGGNKSEEGLTNFLSDFFESKGCKIRLKLV